MSLAHIHKIFTLQANKKWPKFEVMGVSFRIYSMGSKKLLYFTVRIVYNEMKW